LLCDEQVYLEMVFCVEVLVFLEVVLKSSVVKCV